MRFSGMGESSRSLITENESWQLEFPLLSNSDGQVRVLHTSCDTHSEVMKTFPELLNWVSYHRCGDSNGERNSGRDSSRVQIHG